MRRLRIGIFLSFVVMLTACASNANSSENTEPVQPEAYSAEQDSENSAVESDGDDNAGNSSETAQADDKAEDISNAAQSNDESDEPDTIYLKPCNTYQDILDNVYEVIVSDSTAGIVEADELFSSPGIWETRIGRDTDENLSAVGYVLYDVDGNGIEELIIADTGESVWDNRLLLMYSLLDGKPVLVIDGWVRNRYYLLNDNTIYNEGSGGAAYTTFAAYRMAKDGVSLEVIDYYFSDYRDDSSEEYWLVEGNWGWFHNTTGEHKKDESEWMEFENNDVPWEMMDAYLAQVKELDLIFFETMRP